MRVGPPDGGMRTTTPPTAYDARSRGQPEFNGQASAWFPLKEG